MKVDQSDFNKDFASVKSKGNAFMRVVTDIESFPEIISETSVKVLSERDFNIKREKIQSVVSDHPTYIDMKTEGKSTERFSIKTKRTDKVRTDKVDIPNLKKKLVAMKKRLQANIDGVIIEEGYNSEEMSGR
jgi:hypothetical protein